MRKTKAEKGITLVALIITIIVLLILAVVAINAVQNDGIIEYAKNARYSYEGAQKNEQASLDYYLSQIQSNTGKGITHAGIIPNNGTYKREGEELGSGEKFPEKPQTGDIYLYGDYEYRYNLYCAFDDEITTATWKQIPEGNDAYNGWGVKLNVDRDKESYGEILTTINNYNITALNFLYAACENLKVSPKLPSGSINMSSTFYRCKTLKKAPEIPNNVFILASTFNMCDALQEAHKIPDGVTNMQKTFHKCKSLKKAPEIPINVTNMKATFEDCVSLTGEVVIKTKEIKTYDSCFGIDNPEAEVTNPITLVGINFNENTKTYENQAVLEKLKDSATGRNKANVTIKGVD